MSLEQFDKEIFDLTNQELVRQCEGLEMIASENFTLPEVMEVMGSVLTNKYAEGYPGKRYYGGCEFVDEIENLAIERCKKLFNCSFANVQPNSGSQANQGVYAALLNPGDKILVPTPVWALYFQLIKLTGAIPVQIDTSKDDFILTPERLETVLQNEGKGAKAIILTDPSNPTGRVYPAATLKALAEVITKYHLFSVTDEIYGELVYDNNVHHSLSQYIPERNILISGLSKAYAMTGWRLGYIAAPADIMKTIQKVNAFLVTSVSDNVQAAAIEALNKGQADPLEARKIYEDRLKFMKTGLEKLGFEMSTPQGAFYIFAKIPDTFGTDDEAFANELATKAKVGVTPGRYFGKGGQGYVRMSYASSTEQLQEALKRIAKFVENI